MKITNTSIIILVLFVLIGCSSNKWNPHTQFAEDHFLYINTATGKMDSTISLAQYPKRNIIAIDYYCDSTLHINGTKIDTTEIFKTLNTIIFNKSSSSKYPESYKQALVLLNSKHTLPDCNPTFRHLHLMATKAIKRIHESRARDLGVTLKDTLFSVEEITNQDQRIFLNIALYEPPEFREIMVKLPPWQEDTVDYSKLKKRNKLSLVIDSLNNLSVNEKPVNISSLKAIVKQFITNPNESSTLSEDPTKALIIFQNHRGTTYESYIEVYNLITEAYNELWNDLSLKLYKEEYGKLNPDSQKEIRNRIPKILSELEPTGF